MRIHQTKTSFLLDAKLLIIAVYRSQIRVVLHQCFLLLGRIPLYRDLPLRSLEITYHHHLVHSVPLPGNNFVSRFKAANYPLYNSSVFNLKTHIMPVKMSRDGRYNAPRASSNLAAEEQQRMPQYNHVPGRNMQQPGLPVPGTDRGVRMLPGGNSVGMISGMNRNMPMSRPGYQGMNSGTMLSSSMAGMPSPAGMHSGPGSGNSMIRPREALHMMRVSFSTYYVVSFKKKKNHSSPCYILVHIHYSFSVYNAKTQRVCYVF